MYYILYAILYLFSILPLRVLYFISDGCYLLIYYILGYRKDVVMQNLLIAFPEKTVDERKRIAKNFYHLFIDSMIETIKLLSASDAFFEKRFTGNWELVDRFYKTGRSVQLHLGHNFNWEWGNVVLQKHISYQFLGVYMPIKNKAMNRLFFKMRSRSGGKLLSAKNMAREFLPYRNEKYCLGFVADQNPGKAKSCLWVDFFNRKTAFTIGPAKNAIKYDTVVIFAHIIRLRRGYYEVTFSVAAQHPKETTDNALTEKFADYLENVIRNNPPMWLWSHRRWKRVWSGNTNLEI